MRMRNKAMFNIICLALNSKIECAMRCKYEHIECNAYKCTQNNILPVKYFGDMGFNLSCDFGKDYLTYIIYLILSYAAV